MKAVPLQTGCGSVVAPESANIIMEIEVGRGSWWLGYARTHQDTGQYIFTVDMYVHRQVQYTGSRFTCLFTCMFTVYSQGHRLGTGFVNRLAEGSCVHVHTCVQLYTHRLLLYTRMFTGCVY